MRQLIVRNPCNVALPLRSSAKNDSDIAIRGGDHSSGARVFERFAQALQATNQSEEAHCGPVEYAGGS